MATKLARFKTSMNFFLNLFKIEHQAHGGKTSDPVINTTGDEDLILRPGISLAKAGVKNETEISFFKKEDYLEYQKNPTLSW